MSLINSMERNAFRWRRLDIEGSILKFEVLGTHDNRYPIYSIACKQLNIITRYVIIGGQTFWEVDMCNRRKLDLIVKRLKKYPFTEKMLFCQVHSTRMMTPTSLDILNTPDAVYPWELEVFAELSLFASGDAPTKHMNQTANVFVKIINREKE